MTPGLAIDLVDALPHNVALLDDKGIIVAVNRQWRDFARENGGDCNEYYVGTSYPAICELALPFDSDGSIGKSCRGLREMLAGERETLAVEYPFDTPQGLLWCQLRATHVSHGGRQYTLVQHEDITLRRQAEEQLHQTEAVLRNVLDALPVGVWIMNAEGRIVEANPEGLEIWSGARYVDPSQFGEYKGWWLDSGKQIAAEEWAGARAILKGETSINEEIMIESFTGEKKIILNSAIPLRDHAGRVEGAIIVNQDISARKKMEDELRRAGERVESSNRQLREVLAREQEKARTDALTGLHNRRYFFELGTELFNIAQRYRQPLSLLMFDVDHFKRFNDLFGHQAGDAVLAHVARVAGASIREADVLARYGGEEFVVILPNTDAHGAYLLAENVRERIAGQHDYIDGRDMRVTVSVGVAELLPSDGHLEELVSRADKALYMAKNSGRNCTRLFHHSPPQHPPPSVSVRRPSRRPR